MYKTLTFVTSQYSGDRIIKAAGEISKSNSSELLVVGVMDNQYEIDPNTVDYLFKQAKNHEGTMHLVFNDNALEAIRDVISAHSSKYIVTGMPDSNRSILYVLWKAFPEKNFFTVDIDGTITEVANSLIMASS